MLKDTFFTINSFVDSENGRTYHISLNGSHPIFLAHFAGNPIIPGACIVQLIKELSADFFDNFFFISAVKNMKFLHSISPLDSPEISVQLSFTKLENEHCVVAAVLKNDEKIFTKSILLLNNIKK